MRATDSRGVRRASRHKRDPRSFPRAISRSCERANAERAILIIETTLELDVENDGAVCVMSSGGKFKQRVTPLAG